LIPVRQGEAVEVAERSQILSELCGAAVVTVDSGLRIMHANLVAGELLGSPPEVLLGLSLCDYFPEAARERQRTLLERVLAPNGYPVRWMGELELAGPGGPLQVDAAFQEHAAPPRRLTAVLRARGSGQVADDALGLAARSLSALTGESLFRALVVDLAAALRAEHVFAAELLPGGRRLRSVALYVDGKLRGPIECDLEGTPWENLVAGGTAGWPAAVQKLFPRDPLLTELGAHALVGTPLQDSASGRIGILAALYRTPQAELGPARALLEIFAARAGAELERQQVVRGLRAREERLELALWGTDLGLWDWRIDEDAVVYDAQYEMMLGYPAGEAPRGMHEWELSIHADDRNEAMRRLRDHLDGAIPHYESTHRLRTADGGWKWIFDRGKVVARDEQGRPLRMVGTHRDVSEHHRLEEQLAQSQKMDAIGRLAGGVAHDFNNLLTSILSAAEFAGEVLPEGSPAREDLAVVREAALRASQLTRQLLAFARKQVVAPRVVSLNGLLLETERMLRRMVGEDVEIATRVSADIWPVKVDPAQLQQVLVNLAVNARAAMPRGGRLVFETRNLQVTPEPGEAREVAPGDWVLLSVSDSGTGMSSETMARIFEPFFTTKEAGRGTGLGLATVYGTVKQAGGHISVSSELGRGTRFDILLPRAEGVAQSEAARPSGPTRGGGETVLLVEDDALVLDVNTRALTTLGYKVLPCRSGADALERTRSHGARIDLLVSDVVMPRMSGPALARALEAIRPGLRTLFVSGYAEELMAAHPRAPAPFLPKPFTPRALAAKVREVLDGPPAPSHQRDTLAS
jgi:two-component system, cell cycle sensor histidine kinase and response regulator CckA